LANGATAKAGVLRDPIEQSLADGEARTEEVRYARLEGVQQVTTSPLPDDLGTGARLVVLLKDMSAKREEQERLYRAARLSDIGQLAAGVAHEINTPLASIALRAESLLRSTGDSELLAIDAFKNFPRYLKTIDEETFRCKKIIGALLEFASSRKREARPVDLNLLAERAADLVGHQMKLRHVALTLDLEPALPLLPADDGQLRQVLIALMMNALDATAAGGKVEVQTRSAAGSVTLRVSDTGSGIAPELRDKIFNPFFTTKPPGQGTGLGLALCHGIVVAHGGQIHVESEPGRGTAMSVVLPVEA
jgi:signal transduction histidine kinase